MTCFFADAPTGERGDARCPTDRPSPGAAALTASAPTTGAPWGPGESERWWGAGSCGTPTSSAGDVSEGERKVRRSDNADTPSPPRVLRSSITALSSLGDRTWQTTTPNVEAI